MLQRFFVGLVFVTAVALTGFAQAADFSETTLWIPVTTPKGVSRLFTRVCTPVGANNARVVIFNHGSPPGPINARLAMMPMSCEGETGQWFLDHGYILVSPMRRGYGATGGSWDEFTGCPNHPDFVRAGLESAKDILAVVSFLPNIPNAQNDNVIIVGQSAGGWATIALNSIPHPNVTAIINMAGGRGGHQGPNQNQNCAPDLLIESAGFFGKTATIPMLWIYSENDTYFAPPLSGAMYHQFSTAGGVAEFIMKPPYGTDGHLEFGGPGGTKIWGADFERYLSSH